MRISHEHEEHLLMNSAQGFKGLAAWQKSMDLVETVYRITRSWPQDERFGLTNQVRRAAVSVPSNIAEGHGRSSNVEFLRFVTIAFGSLSEVETQMLIADRLGYLSPQDSASIRDQCEAVYQVTQGLARFLRQHPDSRPPTPSPALSVETTKN
jgi:four helix bundle protein